MPEGDAVWRVARRLNGALAGERLVRFSGIINEISRAAGRGGVGAVMGSKNVKAVAARGSGRITVADRDQFLTLKAGIT